MALILTLVVTIAAFSVLWALHLPTKNAGVVDTYWGAGFVVIGTIYALRADQFSFLQFVFLGMVVVWALRLSVYLIRRFATHSNEDPRYGAMRARGGTSFWWTSLPMIFILQALVLWVIATPLHTALTLPVNSSGSRLLLGTGLVLFSVGLAIESVADHQLARFKSANPAPGQVLRSGMWEWSRHPNYFGEALIWWGLGLFALALTGALISLLGPLVLTFVLVGITGRLTDEHMQNARATAFSKYKQETSGFVPLPPSFFQKITKKSRPVS